MKKSFSSWNPERRPEIFQFLSTHTSALPDEGCGSSQRKILLFFGYCTPNCMTNWLLVTLHQPPSGSKRASGNRRQEAISNLLKSCKPAPSTIGHPWIATLVPSWFGHPPRKTNKVPVAWIGKWWKGKKFGMVWQCLQRRWLYICTVYALLIILVYISLFVIMYTNIIQ